MVEKLIYLDGIDPLAFFGVNNIRYEKLRKMFPRLKLVARGNQIKAIGEKVEILKFEKKVELVVSFYQRHHNINDSDIDQILNNDTSTAERLNEMSDDTILYGNNGQPVNALTVNQHKLCDEFKRNDLLFAIGPAGTGKTYTAIALAVMAFRSKSVKRIILTRPAVRPANIWDFCQVT